jgi:CRISPR-associated RAMP protein, Cmr1 family
VKRLTFELEFITPAFIGGAYQQAELRPASFVGLLRWWWRALKGECNIENLRAEEVEIFGGIAKNPKNEEIKKMASPVYLRVEGDVRKGSDLINECRLNTGVGYLYHFVTVRGKREFIEPGSRIELTLIGKDEVLKHYIASLWALVFLGGVGARSRRGGGNLAVVNYEPKDLVEDLKISFTPTNNIYEWLKENLKRAKELVGSPKTPCDKYGECECEYSTLPDPASSDFKLEVSKKTFNTWYEALNDIGKEFMRFRRENKQSVFDTAVFGLPVMHSNGKFVEAERGIRRRSSPVIIKVVKTPEDKYKWMVLRLRGKFLPDGTKLRFGEKPGEPSSDLDLIEEFFRRLKERQKNE